MFCKYCGNEVADNMKFCTKCGKPVQNAHAAPSGQRTKKNKVVVPLAAPGQQQMRPNPVGQSNQQPEPKKKNGALIALIVVVALLVVAVVVLAVAVFSGRISTGSTGNTSIEQADDEDREEDDQDKNKKDGDEDNGNDGNKDSDKQTNDGDNGQLAKEDASEKEDEDELFQNNFKEDTKDAAEDAEEDDDLIFQSNNDDYVLPDSSTRLLTEEDLAPIADDARLLRIARNEIYARHHRKFKDDNKNLEPMQPYFDSKEWYDGYIEADDFREEMLSKIERENIKLIQKYEAKL